MIPIRGPISDMVCNQSHTLGLQMPQSPTMPSFFFLSCSPSSISYLVCHIRPPYLSYTSHSTSLISPTQLLAFTPSYHLYSLDLTRQLLSYHTTAHLYFATLHPSIFTPIAFCFPDGSYLPHLYRLLLLKPFVRNSVVCLIVSRRSTICLVILQLFISIPKCFA